MHHPGREDKERCPGPARAAVLARREHICNDPGEGRTNVAGKCDICGKTKSFGNNVSFSKKSTNRDFRPNVQKKRLMINGEAVRLNVCTRCMRTLGKAGKAA
jgi:large subunit ribosomal protein L28